MAANHAAIMTRHHALNNPQQPSTSRTSTEQANDTISTSKSDTSSTKKIADVIIKSKPKTQTIGTFDKIEINEDIDNFLDPETCINETLKSIEKDQEELVKNFDNLCEKLKAHNLKVTEASLNCLYALNDNVVSTCDEIDEGIKASYKLMATCDGLTKDLSTISNFTTEVRNLRKKVETLEKLYTICRKNQQTLQSSH